MLTLDLPHRQFLGPALTKILDLPSRAKDELAFRVTLEEINDFVEMQWKALKLISLGPPHLYRLRHGGASFEAAGKFRDMVGIQALGPVADREVREELREGRQAASKSAEPRHSKTWPKVSSTCIEQECCFALSNFSGDFSGCGRLGKSVHRVCGWPVLLWDITYGPEYDLTCRQNQKKILRWIQTGQVRAGHLGTPRNSFSRARDQLGGPPPLRSDKCPMGLPGLRLH